MKPAYSRLLNCLVLAILLGAVIKPMNTVLADDSQLQAKQVADINSGTANSSPEELVAAGNLLFFTADDGEHGRELYISEPPFSDATMVADINSESGSSSPAEMVFVDDVLFFTADDGISGVELWKSEAPYTDAERVKDIYRGERGSEPADLYVLGSTLFFSADDGSYGREIWKCEYPYDSTTTNMVMDVYHGVSGSSPEEIVSVGWMLFFVANNGTYHSEIWKSEPPYSSATRISNIYKGGNADVDELTVVNTTLFFSAESEDSGQELWKITAPYDSADVGRVTDFSGKTDSLNPTELVAIDSTLFFTGYYEDYGYELWKSVPPYQPTSTYRINDAYPGTMSSNPQKKTVVGDTLVFSAYEQGNGQELYKIEAPYNGENIYRIAETNDGKSSSSPDDITVYNSTIYFTAENDEDYGRELWKAEPPYFSAELVTDLMPGVADSDPDNLTLVGSSIVFSAAAPDYGIELYKLGSGIQSGASLPATGYAPGVVTEVEREGELNYVSSGNDDMILKIPSLGVSTGIVGIPVTLDGWDLNWLDNQVGYLEDTAFPTWDGNTAIVGHLYLSNGAPGPFINLETMKYGEQIIIDAWGQRYIYEVRNVGAVHPDDMSVLGHKDEDWITLITCQDYDEKHGNYDRRLIVQAVLIKIVSV